MAIEIPRVLVEFILLGPEDDRRQLQDSPILGDVWVEFAKDPGEKLEVLITPYREQAAGSIAHALAECDELEDTDIAYLQGIVAARLSFDQVLRFVVPMTQWWSERGIAQAMSEYMSAPHVMQQDIQAIFEAARKWLKGRSAPGMQDVETRKRYIALAGLLLWAKDQPSGVVPDDATSKAQMQAILDRDIAGDIAAALKKMFESRSTTVPKGLVWTVSLNRRASPALTKSIPAVKADAARTLFTVNCSELVWAVIDSGIDASHYAFAGKEGVGSRIKRSFDFTKIRDIISLNNLRDAGKRRQRAEALLARKLLNPPSPEEVDDYLSELAKSARKGRSIDWELIERLVEIDPRASVPPTNHGTHVAGIIAASRQAAKEAAEIEANRKNRPESAATTLQLASTDGQITEAGTAALESRDTSGARAAAASERAGASQSGESAPVEDRRASHEDGSAGARPVRAKEPSVQMAQPYEEYAVDCADGMCPDIYLYDFRVLAPTLKETEFAIIAALQYIRYINDRNSFITIHGANLSLSIPHDARNYACGRTPVCNECERLVASGVVVVAAAGNRGYQNFETKEGLYESYAAFSITDPGNAESVITVGATHRFWPHTYGVSFFSSRGPTGDGRLKPDLVAPGERIRAPLPSQRWGDLDGTSMAAPHVSGAAAMLMARYTELIGQPRRIKQILCESATDLGREKSFQGHGMLDVLRALQSI
ncbi:MAG: S8 family serine peptidase [Burkholderiales bacterium]